MSETAKKLFDSLKNEKTATQSNNAQPEQTLTTREALKEAVVAIAPGVKNFVRDFKSELSRTLMQGRSELAAALFSGSNAFVPYGQGQWQGKNQDQEKAGQERPQERGGMER